ncbi:hypothetical protein EUTSA_v10028182mg, partial [Eutrema salsugineum]
MAGAESHSAYLETNLGTNIAILFHDGESITDFKERLCNSHREKCPQFGEISISGFKVERGGLFFHLSDDDFLGFAKAHEDLILHVELLRVKTKEKRQKEYQMRKKRKLEQRQKQIKPFKNRDESPLDMGNVNCAGALEEALPMEIANDTDANKNIAALEETPMEDANVRVANKDIAALEEALPMENANEIDANKNIAALEETPLKEN